jgi:hypothetical protein
MEVWIARFIGPTTEIATKDQKRTDDVRHRSSAKSLSPMPA